MCTVAAGRCGSLLPPASVDCRLCWLLPSSLPAAPVVARHGLPGGPASTSVGGGGSVTEAIPVELSVILVAHSQTVREDGTARTPEEC